MNSPEDFKKLVKEYIGKYLELNPAHGTDLGLHQFDGKIGDESEKGHKNAVDVAKSFLERFKSINRNELSKADRYELDAAIWSAEMTIFNIEEIQSYKKNPMHYAFVFSGLHNYISREYAPFDERLASVVSIMKKIPEVLNTAENNLNKTLPRVLCRYARHFSQGYEDFFKVELLNVISDRSKDEMLKNEYIIASNAAVEAFNKYINFLDRASSVEDKSNILGKEKFMKMLFVNEHIEINFEELKASGEKELARLQNELKKILDDNDFHDKLESLEHDHPSEDSLVSDTENTLYELIEFIRKNNIVNLPEELNCIVTEMPRYMNFGFAAMNTAGPFEKSSESFYYVNLPEKDWDEKKKEEWMTQFNFPILKLISIHEAYPGHYTHFLNSNLHASDISKIFMSYSYVEGWAHYTEEMMIELGYSGNDFKSKIGMLLEAMIRCCRYMVAIGIHCEGMSEQEAKEYFIKNAFMTETTALQEAERGAFDPGYINYTLGKIYLRKFKDDYFQKFGDSKTLKDFHDMIVSLGCPTYRIARDFILN
ncbi:MAG TPA: DUF885 domain-containing protein [Ignavibacteria bacterium]|nr:hypothetical protein [Bacteroidota bacterium]HRI86279.1 DUF885 domain-containing protein [Ignavibacteria bacterium]HRK00546.1 DUF885 domain-containing protein [Ignavibacteria bacterium]